MNTPSNAERKAAKALRGVCLELPHLCGLAAVAELRADPRVPTAAVARSGRILFHPDWFLALSDADARFVLAHELYHLCLRTHDRAAGGDAALWNEAHDYVINDILRIDLGRPVPNGALVWPDARHLSGERIVLLLKRRNQTLPLLVCPDDESPPPPPDPFRPPPRRPGAVLSRDVMPDHEEQELFPDDRLHSDMEVYRKAADALHLDRLRSVLRASAGPGPGGFGGEDPNVRPEVLEAAGTGHRPPWQEAVQHWLEAVAPGPRSFARPSRRGADRTDVVLPGRTREGWAVHLVMANNVQDAEAVRRFLGHLGGLCEAANVGAVHYLQCHTTTSTERWVDPADLARFKVHMCGCYGVAEPMSRLADDPEVEAALVFHAGEVVWPEKPPPFRVLWVVPGAIEFRPAYGTVVRLDD